MTKDRSGSDFNRLLTQAVEAWAKLTPAEQDKMLATQRAGYAKAEASWPKASFHYKTVNGTRIKVYDSYEDYCND